MSDNKIIKFPESTFILKCRHCGSKEFYNYLNTNNPLDIAGYECATCNSYWSLNMSHDGEAE